MVTEAITIPPEIGHIAGTDIRTITEEGETIVTEVITGITGPITEITVGPETGTITRGDSDQRYGNRNQDHGRSRDRDGRNRSSSRESSQSRGSSQNRYKSRRQSRNNSRNRDRSDSRSRSSSHVSTNQDRGRCYRCNEYDHFARECPNDTSNRNPNNAENSLLRMTDDGHAYAADYTEGEDFDIALNL